MSDLLDGGRGFSSGTWAYNLTHTKLVLSVGFRLFSLQYISKLELLFLN